MIEYWTITIAMDYKAFTNVDMFWFKITVSGQAPPKQRSRRNSIDLYTADYDIKLVCDKATKESQSMKMMQRSSSHIKIDDIANSKIKLCPRCHSPHCNLEICRVFGDLKCPRCLEWEHWEDSCWTVEDPNDHVSWKIEWDCYF